MARETGRPPLVHYSEMAYMGFAEVLRHLPSIARILRQAKEAITATRPDALILIDYPSFNLKLARHAKTLGIPVFFYISPKVWAWKEWRVKEMRRYCDKILSILPFEVSYFSGKGLDVEYVGNPSVAEVERKKGSMPSRAEFNLLHGLDPNRPLLALVPGSRRGEIKGNLPVMVEAALRFPSLQPVVAAAPTIPRDFYRSLEIPGLQHMPVISGSTFPLMALSTAAFVTSGTATLECALLGTPQVVCYRSSGSKLFYNIMSHVLKCPHVTLPNLIANGLDGQRYAPLQSRRTVRLAAPHTARQPRPRQDARRIQPHEIQAHPLRRPGQSGLGHNGQHPLKKGHFRPSHTATETASHDINRVVDGF